MAVEHSGDDAGDGHAKALRRVVLVVAALNLGYFGIEFAVALAIGSVSLFADSVDFLEDASINILIAVAIGWSARRRARLGMGLALIILAPALAGLWTAWQKLAMPVPPAPWPLTLDRNRRPAGQHGLRAHPGALSPSPRQPDQGGLSVGTE